MVLLLNVSSCLRIEDLYKIDSGVKTNVTSQYSTVLLEKWIHNGKSGIFTTGRRFDKGIVVYLK